MVNICSTQDDRINDLYREMEENKVGSDHKIHKLLETIERMRSDHDDLSKNIEKIMSKMM